MLPLPPVCVSLFKKMNVKEEEEEEVVAKKYKSAQRQRCDFETTLPILHLNALMKVCSLRHSCNLSQQKVSGPSLDEERACC